MKTILNEKQIRQLEMNRIFKVRTLDQLINELTKVRGYSVSINITAHVSKIEASNFEGVKSVLKKTVANEIIDAVFELIIWCKINRFI